MAVCRAVSVTMDKIFDLFDPEDCTELNRLLNRHGIHIEQNLMNQPYVIIDCRTFRNLSSTGGRPPKISDDIRQRAMKMKYEGTSVRKISKELGISIGAVSAITKQSRK